MAVPQSIAATPPHPTTPHVHHHPTAAAADSNDEYDGDDNSQTSYVCQFNAASAKWECVKSDYKSVVLQRIMDSYESGKEGGSRAVIDQLKEFGITVYLADHDYDDMNHLLRQVVHHVMSSKSDRSRSAYENQRCLLYRDENDRLYNLTLNNGSSGLAGTWKSLLISFSGLQSVAAMTVLSRAYACSPSSSAGTVLSPGYLSLILGLVLYEEISHVLLNVAMFVRGVPSVAAYTLLSNFDSDWPRKLAVFLLALTSAMVEGSDGQRYCTLAGIGLAMVLLAANLGARAWYYMKWKPVTRGCCSDKMSGVSSVVAPFLSLLLATLAGLVFPYIGFTRIQQGGKAAVQLVVANCVLVSLLFVASDLDAVQQFVVVGSEECNQDGVNITMGIWFAMTAVTCIFASQKIEATAQRPEDKDPILVEEQTSPVGLRVPNFPDFPIDPLVLRGKGLSCCTLKWDVIVGVFISIGMGAFVVTTGLFEYMDTANAYISSA